MGTELKRNGLKAQQYIAQGNALGTSGTSTSALLPMYFTKHI